LAPFYRDKDTLLKFAIAKYIFICNKYTVVVFKIALANVLHGKTFMSNHYTLYLRWIEFL